VFDSSGTLFNNNFITSLNNPYGITIDNNGYIYISNNNSGTVGKYDNNGNPINTSLITGLNKPCGVAIDDLGNILVANIILNTIGKYNSSGYPIDISYISGLNNPYGLLYEKSSGFLYVANHQNLTVGKYYIKNITCFKEGSKILTKNGYIPIENLKKGDYIKTLKNDFVPIELIGKTEINHRALNTRIKDQLYECSQNEFPEIFEPLIITGCHCILVENSTSVVNAEKMEEVKKINGNIYLTEGMLRIPSCIDERTSVYKNSGTYTIYHFALENDDYYMNYGIWANGLLVETCSKRFLKEFSRMELMD